MTRWSSAAVSGVLSARTFTAQVLQRERGDRQLRFALVGLPFPEDRGQDLSIVQGQPLAQAHGDIIVDASLGIAIGERMHLGRDDYRVVGLTKQLLASGGEGVVFATVSDTQRVLADDSRMHSSQNESAGSSAFAGPTWVAPNPRWRTSPSIRAGRFPPSRRPSRRCACA